MPRDGSGIYTQPFPNVVDGTTIESAVYNGYTHDVETDLNTPRPIVAGGTGANNAHDAMIALSGEIAYQTVTNYNSHVFFSGSFKSAPGATGAPNPTDYFVGQVVDYNGNSMMIIAYSGTTAGSVYSRVKSFIDGTWGAWVAQTTIADLDARYVNVTGDAMSGGLTVTGTVQATNTVSATSATTGTYFFGSDGTRSLSYNGTDYTLSGGQFNVGSNTIVSGSLSASGALEVGSMSSAGTAFIDFHSSGTGSDHDARISSAGGSGTAGQGTLTTTCGSYVINNNGEGVVVGQFAGTNPIGVNLIRGDPGGGVTTYLQAVQYTSVWLGLIINVPGGIQFSFRHTGEAHKPSGSTSWIVASDARIKDVASEYTAGLDAVAALRPVRFIYKGNNTDAPPENFAPGTKTGEEAEQLSKMPTAVPYKNSPNYGPAAKAIEYVGLVAQEAELTMPELIKKDPGYIDGQAVDDLRSAEYTPLLFALVNAVKELKARIEELEAGG
jgi:hypothetical protein